MLLRNAVKEKIEDKKKTYNIGFVNLEGCNDETQFDAESIEDLNALWEDFCKENDFKIDSVTYVECIGLAEEESEELFLPKYTYLKNISKELFDLLHKGEKVPKKVLNDIGITTPEGMVYLAGDSFIKVDRLTKPLEVYCFDYKGRYYYYIIVTPVDDSLAFAVDLYPVTQRGI